MSHFVRLARRLFELNNFHSSYAVLAALESCPIARLVQTHALLPKRDRLMWEELAMRMSSDSNWKSFRDYQESAGYPRIPHIGKGGKGRVGSKSPLTLQDCRQLLYFLIRTMDINSLFHSKIAVSR